MVYVHLDLERERELNLRLNRNIGNWDWDLLAEFEPEFLTSVGFTEDDLAMVFEVGEAGAGAQPFVAFNEGGEGMPGVTFKFGDYGGRVSQEVYERFCKAFDAQRAAGKITIDDALRATLGL